MSRAIACAALLALCCNVAHAKDLGTRGEVFPVIEPDLFSEIAKKFAALEAAGEVDKINEQLRQRAIANAERPQRVEGVKATVEPRRFHFDPTVVLTEDIKTPDGTLIAEAGTSFNPLDYSPMRQKLIFFDGDVERQVNWAKEEMAAQDVEVSAILVNGPVLDLTRDWRRQVFFDQGGKLVAQFGIRQVPARVTRDGDKMLIEEVTP